MALDGVVEVRDLEQKCWHSARICDVSKEKVQVAFDIKGMTGPAKSWVPWNTVREPPEQMRLDLVDVRTAAAPSSPSL